MAKLSAKGQKWLKGFHLLTVACWLGGGVALNLLYFLKNGITDGDVLYGINKSIHHIDMNVVVIPGAIGTIVTGLIYSIFTKWGFFKHNWVTVKWIITFVGMLMGIFFLGPWESGMMEISGEVGAKALNDPQYLHYEKMGLIFGVLQWLMLVFAVFISILKPWRRGQKAMY